MRSPHLPKLRFVGCESTEPALRRAAQEAPGVPRSWCQSLGESLEEGERDWFVRMEPWKRAC